MNTRATQPMTALNASERKDVESPDMMAGAAAALPWRSTTRERCLCCGPSWALVMAAAETLRALELPLQVIGTVVDWHTEVYFVEPLSLEIGDGCSRHVSGTCDEVKAFAATEYLRTRAEMVEPQIEP